MADILGAKSVACAPTEGVARLFAVGGFERGPHQVAGTLRQDSIVQQSHGKLRQIVSRREPASPRDFVARIKKISIEYFAGFIFLIKASAVRDDGEAVVGTRACHSSAPKYLLGDKIHIFFARSAFNDTAGK